MWSAKEIQDEAISIKFNLAQVSIQNWCGAMKPEGVGRPSPPHPFSFKSTQLGLKLPTIILKGRPFSEIYGFAWNFRLNIHCIHLPLSFQFRIGRQIASRLVPFYFRNICCDIIAIDIFFFFSKTKNKIRYISYYEKKKLYRFVNEDSYFLEKVSFPNFKK